MFEYRRLHAFWWKHFEICHDELFNLNHFLVNSASRRKADVSCKMWNRWKTWRANGWTDRFWCRRSQTSLQGRAEGWSWVDVGRVFLEVELGCASKELQVVQNHDYRYYNPGIHCVYDKPHVSHVPRWIFNGCPVSRSYEFLGGWWGCTSKKGLPIWTSRRNAKKTVTRWPCIFSSDLGRNEWWSISKWPSRSQTWQW